MGINCSFQCEEEEYLSQKRVFSPCYAKTMPYKNCLVEALDWWFAVSNIKIRPEVIVKLGKGGLSELGFCSVAVLQSRSEASPVK